MSDLYAHLENKGHFIIFFIDELDAVFAGDGEAYSNVISQLLAISEMSCDTRRIVVVATVARYVYVDCSSPRRRCQIG